MIPKQNNRIYVERQQPKPVMIFTRKNWRMTGRSQDHFTSANHLTQLWRAMVPRKIGLQQPLSSECSHCFCLQKLQLTEWQANIVESEKFVTSWGLRLRGWSCWCISTTGTSRKGSRIKHGNAPNLKLGSIWSKSHGKQNFGVHFSFERWEPHGTSVSWNGHGRQFQPRS